MRTSINNIVANVNVFGIGQDRVVVSSLLGTCAHAAQHLETRHAKRARGEWAKRDQRYWLMPAATAAAAATLAKLIMSLAIVGPQRLGMRQMSSALVLA